MRHARTALVVLLTWTAIACGTVNDTIGVRDAGKLDFKKPKLLQAHPALRFMDEAALLSAAVYDKPELPATAAVEQYCEDTADVAFDATSLGWQELEGLPEPKDPPAGTRVVRGLLYRAWFKNFGTEEVVVLAFRGTQSSSDWFSNLRWLTRVVPRRWDHYEQLESVMPELIAAIRSERPNATIIAAGHSLGGGLAQLAGYASNGAICTVYGFDPSVVTYFYGVDKPTRDRSRKGQDIYRIFEQGEVLSYVRWFAKRFYPISHKNPRVVQVKFHLLRGGLIRNHSMRRFACACLKSPEPVAHNASR